MRDVSTPTQPPQTNQLHPISQQELFAKKEEEKKRIRRKRLEKGKSWKDEK